MAVFLIGLGASLVAAALLRANDRAHAERAHERRVLQVSSALHAGFDRPLEVLYSIPALFSASVEVSRAEFRRFVSGPLERHPSIYALEWIPVVAGHARAQVEEAARRDGVAGFRFTQVGPDGTMVVAAPRDEHLPILYMQPPNATALGFDVAAESSRRAPADKARDTAAAVSSPRIRLVEDDASIASVAVFHPVYDNDAALTTLEQRRAALRGHAVVVFRIQPVVELALEDAAREGLQIQLVDEEGPGGGQVLYPPTGPDVRLPVVSGAFVSSREFAFADRKWTLRVTSTDLSLEASAMARSVPLLVAGIGASALLAILVAGLSVVRRLRIQVRVAQQLGQYTLLEKIGAGGMGEVYKARHAMLRRPTAIKLLLPTGDTSKRIARFEREAQMTSRLTHPNTVVVYDYGRTPTGIFYYAMEYLDGITLEDVVREDGPQPPGRLVALLEQVVGALAEAHEVGLIHRDVKPSNLMICSRGATKDFVKVLDFGLVKEVSERHELGLSGTTEVVGTPYYLAPETIKEPDKTSPRSDVYAVGAVAYFALTGRRLFEGETMIEVLSHHLHSEPVPLSHRAPQPIPAQLEEIVMRCVRKDPDERPDSQLLLELLRGCPFERWSATMAERWWATRGAAIAAALRDVQSSPGSRPRGAARTIEVDLRRRT